MQPQRAADRCIENVFIENVFIESRKAEFDVRYSAFVRCDHIFVQYIVTMEFTQYGVFGNG